MGAYLSQPVTTKDTFSGSGSNTVYGGASMQGWRRSMEDAHIAQTGMSEGEETSLFGVFDGHGGSEVAKFCKKYMAPELRNMTQYQQGRINDSLVEVFHKMDQMLKDDAYHGELDEMRGSKPSDGPAQEGTLSGEQPSKPEEEENSIVSTAEAVDMLKRLMQIKRLMNSEKDDAADETQENLDNPPADAASEPAEPEGEPRIQAGCTAVVALLRGNELFVANAGDSRAVLCRNGQAVPLSHDHKPASEVEKSRIMAAGGFLSEVGGVTRVNGNLNLSRAIGDLKYKSNQQLAAKDQIITAQPDVVQMTLGSSDRFMVLACDGVWDVLSNQDVVNFVNQRLDKNMNCTDIASELLDRCLAPDPKETKGIGCDNMTATIVCLHF